jgi:hypothetical protein
VASSRSPDTTVHGPPYSQTPIYTLYPNSEPLGVLTGRGAKFPRAHRDGPNQSPVEVAQVAGWAICLALQPTPDSSQIPCCQIPPPDGRPAARARRSRDQKILADKFGRAGGRRGETAEPHPESKPQGAKASRAPPPPPMPVPKPMERKQAAYSNLVRIRLFEPRGLLHSLVDHLWSRLSGRIGGCRMRGTRSRGRGTRGSSTATSTSRASTTCGICSTPSSPPGSRNSLVRPNFPSPPLSRFLISIDCDKQQHCIIG